MPSLMRNTVLLQWFFNIRPTGTQNFPRFQGTQPDHVRVKSCCFARALVNFVRPRELLSFDPPHVSCSPLIRKRIDHFACTFCFPNTDHVMILRRFDPLSCSLKRVNADIFMLACTLFNEQDKGSNLLGNIT